MNDELGAIFLILTGGTYNISYNRHVSQPNFSTWLMKSAAIKNVTIVNVFKNYIV